MGRERMLAIALAGLILALAPQVIANNENIHLELSLIEAPEKGWYSSGEIVSISSTIINDGDSTSIDTDPSCGEVLKVWSSSELIFDGSITCNGQSRGMDISAGSTTSLSTLTWDLADSNGEIVKSGDYSIEYFVAGEELSSIIDVHVQTPSEIPVGLTMEVTSNSRTGALYSDSPTIITTRLINSLDESLTVNLDGCLLVIADILYEECIPGSEIFAPHEIRTISHTPLMLDVGTQSFSVSLGDNTLSEEITLNVEQGKILGSSIGDLSTATVEIIIPEDESLFSEDGLLSAIVQISNDGTEDITLDFTDTCRGEIWIIDTAGKVVMDTRTMKSCDEFEMQNLLVPDATRTYSQPGWTFLDFEGCKIAAGDLTIIAEIPEHQIFGIKNINFERAQALDCGSSEITINSLVSNDDEMLVVELSLSTLEQVDISWITACGLESIISNNDGEIDRSLTQCENQEGLIQRIDGSLVLEGTTFDMSGLEDGEYELQIITISTPMESITQTFTWPFPTEINEENDEEENPPEEVQSEIISGTWSAITTDSGICWMLEDSEGELLTLAGTQTTSWTPRTGISGQYKVFESPSSLECAEFAADSFVVAEIMGEADLPATTVEEDEFESETTPVATENEETLSPVVVAIGTVIVSTGIFSLMVAVIASNESWRIPATSAGLWLLGLIGRTSETSDGRYQRGRLTGYLTANPGCHFRALMAALDMSNGQITHHLKVLENEERVWRRADGRLVRFYPYTSNLHPGISEEDLPLPPLSPDPKSLQGKILRLLDDDGQMGDLPTQAELASRLDRSQQLVSHHLRTLQKFGLVEKRRMGMRNRYRLTREAVFLLETTSL